MNNQIPLAERVRPSTLDSFVGQQHLIGKNGTLRKIIESGNVPSITLWGPPGVGKTTLANIIANTVKAQFFTLSAVSAGVKEVRELIQKASRLQNTILFIDEIHRFSKSQQDALLGAVEKGIIKLIGATTENPSFEVNAALLSRSQVYKLEHLSEDDLKKLLDLAISTDTTLQKLSISIKEYDALFRLAGGDARRLLNLLELVIENNAKEKKVITNKAVMAVAQENPVIYDKQGDMHYDVISAFIKSIRGSDPNAAVYWLARMIEGGEDPKFIARRLLILASEDIGNANPTALIMANNCFQAVTVIGYPEARIILSQATIYLASSAKSNASYEAINKAQSEVKASANLPVPLHLRGAYTKLNKSMGYGEGYKYAHAYEGNFVAQEFMPDAIKGTTYYHPGENARENELRNRLKNLWDKKYDY